MHLKSEGMPGLLIQLTTHSKLFTVVQFLQSFKNLCMYVSKHVCVHVPQDQCGGQKTKELIIPAEAGSFSNLLLCHVLQASWPSSFRLICVSLPPISIQ